MREKAITIHSVKKLIAMSLVNNKKNDVQKLCFKVILPAEKMAASNIYSNMFTFLKQYSTNKTSR